MLLADELGMAGEGYSYISLGAGFITPEWWIDTKVPPDGKDHIAKKAGQGHFTLMDSSGGEPFEEFQGYYSKITGIPMDEIDAFVALSYDSLYVVFRAITKLVEEGYWMLRPLNEKEKSMDIDESLTWTVGLNDGNNGSQAPQFNNQTLVLELEKDALLRKVQSQSFFGVTGHIGFDSNGDRLPIIDLLNVQVSDRNFFFCPPPFF